jgi:hypothetical protein
MNRPEQISRLAASHGFEEPEYVFIEEDGPKPYL